MEPAVGIVPAASAVPAAVVPLTGTRINVPLPATAERVAVMKPEVASIVTPVTLVVADGADQPEANGVPLAAFSDTATLAESISDRASVTFARTV